jgi:DNA-binding transcriptional MerR regulator
MQLDTRLDADQLVYSTQAVAACTGIPVTTILAWERRYGLPRPRRSATGRRMYSDADVALLQTMRERTAEGERAEQVARALLSGDESTAGRRELPVYLPTDVQELTCLHCGDNCGELLTQRSAGRLVARFVPRPNTLYPRLDGRGRPHCGRCGGGLYREPGERRSLPPLDQAPDRRAEQGAA